MTRSLTTSSLCACTSIWSKTGSDRNANVSMKSDLRASCNPCCADLHARVGGRLDHDQRRATLLHRGLHRTARRHRQHAVLWNDQCYDLSTHVHVRHTPVQSALQGTDVVCRHGQTRRSAIVPNPEEYKPDVGHVDVCDLDALVRHHGQQQAAGAAVDVVARHDVLAGLHQAHHRHQRRHAAREGKTPVRALSSTRSIMVLQSGSVHGPRFVRFLRQAAPVDGRTARKRCAVSNEQTCTWTEPV